MPTISQATVASAVQYAAQRDLDGLANLLRSEECRAHLEYLIKEEFRRFPDEKTVSESDFYKSLRDEYGANPGVDAQIRKLESTHLDLIISFVLERVTNREYLKAKLNKLEHEQAQFSVDLWLRGHAKFAPLLYLVHFANELTPHMIDDNRQHPPNPAETALQHWNILSCTPIIRMAYDFCESELRTKLLNWDNLQSPLIRPRDRDDDQRQHCEGDILFEQDREQVLKVAVNQTLVLASQSLNMHFEAYEKHEGFRFDRWLRFLAQTGVRETISSLLPQPSEEPEKKLRPLIIDTNSRDSNIVENFKGLATLESFVKYLAQTPLLSDEEKTILKLHFVDKADDLLVAKLLGIGGRNPSDAVRQRRSVIYKKLATGLLVEFALQDDFTRSVVKLAVVLYRDYSLSNVDEETAYREGTSLLEAVANQLGTNLDKVVNAFDGFIDRLEHYFGLDISQTREQALPQGETLLKRVLDFISSKVFACFSLEAPVAEEANEVNEANQEVDEDDRR